jgi:hypothetical protein
MEAENLNVSDIEPFALDVWQHLRQGRDVASGENVFLDPGAGGARAIGTVDGMENRHTIILEECMALAEEFLVVADAHMLEHAD